MARLTPMFMVRNDFPLPGLNDVTTITFDCCPLSVMNSRLVRSTRNASLTMSRLPSFTTTAFSSGAFLRNSPCFLRVKSGISPMNGMLMPSRSLRPRILLFMVSRRKIATTGISMPSTKATSRMFLRMGAVGAMLPLGGVTTRVL